MWNSVRHSRTIARDGYMSILIVPRGLNALYYEFLSLTAFANRDQLVIDRRRSERRRSDLDRSDDRRSTDRRNPLPPTWSRDGVIVLVDDSAAKPRSSA
jgi:hypothetical protein